MYADYLTAGTLQVGKLVALAIKQIVTHSGGNRHVNAHDAFTLTGHADIAHHV